MVGLCHLKVLCLVVFVSIVFIDNNAIIFIVAKHVILFFPPLGYNN
jgi:hypothetical protein